MSKTTLLDFHICPYEYEFFIESLKYIFLKSILIPKDCNFLIIILK